MSPITAEPHRFFDADQGHPSTARIVLERLDQSETELWEMRSRIGYLDRHIGPIVVPERGGRGITDLTSVPQVFTWLVPRTGTHLPAALVHDGLTPPSAGGFDLGDSREITRLDADRVFRDAMADLRTPRIRRWLIWSTVSLPTLAATGRRRAAPAYAGLLAIALLGWLATLDLFDCVDWLPWMGDHGVGRELALGLVMAVVVPVIFGLALWPPGLRSAGIINGLALAMLLHVTVAVVAITVAYQILERPSALFAARHRWARIAAAAVAAGIGTLSWWLCAR